MAKKNTTGARPNLPPAVGKNASVRIDQELYDALAILMRTGDTLSEAVRLAARFTAHGYTHAWARGAIPDGKAPHYMRMEVKPYDAPDQPV